MRSRPYARCHDFARIAFDPVQDDPGLLGLLSQSDGRQARMDRSLALRQRPVPAGLHRVWVRHSANIAEATGVHLPEGGTVLVRPDAAAKRGFSVWGHLLPKDWQALAHH